MSWILTATGTAFDLLIPTAEMVKPLDLAHALANLPRFNGHTRHHYSVAQHSILVAQLVAPKHRLQALLHDAPEAYIGDMVKPLKDLLPEYQHIERRVWLAICEWARIPEQLPPEVKHADLVALATEKRDLMPEHPAPWECLAGIEPHPGTIQQWTIEKASIEYQHHLLAALAAEHRRTHTTTGDTAHETH